MGSLVSCLREAGEFISEDQRAAIIARAAELRSGGATLDEAKMRAAREFQQQASAMRTELEAAIAEGRALYDVLPESEQPKAEAVAEPARPEAPTFADIPERDAPSSARFAALEADSPTLIVARDVDGRPIPLAEEIAAVRREAKEGTPDLIGDNDLGLLDAAVLCALGE
jgi:hypothetical protein